MKILLSTLLLAVIATVSANPDAALRNQHDKHNDDLYQSLVFSHYLNKQGVVGGNVVGDLTMNSILPRKKIESVK